MSPRSLLFSSDQETSRQISHALRELELSVEACPEIFAALKTLTSKMFNLIVVDWDEGLEASFLLKTARESRTHHDVFAVVVGKAEARAALEQAGADLVLSKPLRSEQAKHALLTCNAFTSRLKDWSSQPRELAGAPPVGAEQRSLSVGLRPPTSVVPGWPMPGAAPAEAATDEAPLHLSFATFEGGLAGESIFKRLFQFKSGARRFSLFASTGLRGLLLRGAAIGVVFFAVGYVLSQPLTEASSAAARAGRETWQSIRGWGQRPAEDVQAAAVPAQDVGSDAPQWHGTAGKIKVVPVRNSRSQHARIPFDMPEPIAQRAALQEPAAAPQPAQARAASPRSVNIPDSLGEPFPGVTAAREVAAKVSPALMDALRPVTIPGALSEKLLLQKIDPSYPEKALQAGLRGPVVLQAWIGKDGRIQELKLIRGPLLLGQAAFDAVRNWRYKPYVLNGQAVEAQTLVTVDFNLP